MTSHRPTVSKIRSVLLVLCAAALFGVPGFALAFTSPPCPTSGLITCTGGQLYCATGPACYAAPTCPPSGNLNKAWDCDACGCACPTSDPIDCTSSNQYCQHANPACATQNRQSVCNTTTTTPTLQVCGACLSGYIERNGTCYSAYVENAPTNAQTADIWISGRLAMSTPGTVPATAAGIGVIYYDSVAKRFKVSVDNGSYNDLLTSGTAYFANGGNTFGAPAFLGTIDNYSLTLSTNALARLTVDTSGNVGIGTATPNNMLHVYKTTANPEIDIQGVSGVNNHWAIYNERTSPANSLRFWVNSTGNAGDAANNVMTLGHDGNTGLGAAPMAGVRLNADVTLSTLDTVPRTVIYGSISDTGVGYSTAGRTAVYGRAYKSGQDASSSISQTGGKFSSDFGTVAGTEWSRGVDGYGGHGTYATGLYGMGAYGTSASSGVEAWGGGSPTIYGVQGMTNDSTATTGYGVRAQGANATGTNYGMASVGTGGANSYGLNASGTGSSTSNTGVYAMGSGGATSYGLNAYASASPLTYGVNSSIVVNAGQTGYALYADAGTGGGTEYAGIFLNGNVGIGTAAPVYTLDVVNSTRARSINVANTYGTGTTYGVYASNSSANAGSTAIVGTATSTTAANYGVVGTSASTSGIGVSGTSPYYGVYGTTSGSVAGVYGTTSGSGQGVRGTVFSTGTGVGVWGQQTNAGSGAYYGVKGETAATGGGATGVYGTATAVSGTVYGVQGASVSPSGYGGVFTNSSSGVGLYASSASGYAAIFNVGNVGIGTSAPGSQLHLYKNAASSNAEIAIQSGNGTTLQDKWSIYQAGTDGSGDLRFWNANVPASPNSNHAMIVKEDGTVVVGKLRFNGGTPAVGSVLLSSDASGNAQWTSPSCLGTKFAGTTYPATVAGAAGGYTGINATCNAAFPGSHICTPDEIMTTIQCASGTLPGTTACGGNPCSGWIANGAPGFTSPAVNDCQGWNKPPLAPGYYGDYWSFATTTGGFGSATDCNISLPVICCK